MKILYRLTPLEQRYLDKYMELPEDTRDKLADAGISGGKAMEFVNDRMDIIWKEMRQERVEELLTKCPFLT